MSSINYCTLLAIFILIINSLSFKPIINSLLFQELQSHNETETEEYISSYLQSIMKKCKYAPNSIIGIPIVSSLETSIISVDAEKPINIDLPFENGDIATDIMELLYISKQGEMFSFKSFFIKYLFNPNHVIQSISPKIENLNNETSIQCSYSIGNNSYNYSSISLTYHYDTILRYSSLTFGHSSLKGRVDSLRLDSYSKISITDISHYEDIQKPNDKKLQEINISKAWSIDQEYLKNVYLVILSSVNSSLLFYIINLHKDNSFNISFDIRIAQTEFKDYVSIQKFGKYNNYYLATSSLEDYKGLIKFLQKGNTWISSNVCNKITDSNGNEIALTITDFIINEITLYVIADKIGLVIFKFSDHFSSNKLFRHSHMKLIDFHVNPFYGHKFIGISIDNNYSEGKEKFIEFLIESETRPLLNKIFLSFNQSFLPYYTVDSFFSYFYDLNTNQLLLIRRGMLNSVPYLTYKLFCDKNKTPRFLFSLYDINTDQHYLALMFDTSLSLFYNISLSNHKLNCTFHEEGFYNLTFVQRGEVCSVSLESNDSYTSCQKIIKYNFHVFKSKNSALTISIIVLFTSIIVLFSILFCFLSYYTKCFRKFDSLALKVPRDSKGMTYQNTINNQSVFDEAKKIKANEVKDTFETQNSNSSRERERDDKHANELLSYVETSVRHLTKNEIDKIELKPLKGLKSINTHKNSSLTDSIPKKKGK